MSVANPNDKVVRIPFIDSADLRPGQETLLTKDQVCVNGYFEPVQLPGMNLMSYHFIKRPGFSTFQTVSPTGPGRGIYAWKATNKLYSVNNNKILSGNTDLGVTLTTSAGIINFEETRPGATTQYLGINDGVTLVLIATDDSVIILNNVSITSSSVANPTHIITGSAHNLNTGNKIIIRNHTGSTPSLNYDGTGGTIYTITKVNATEFTIPVNVTVGGTGGTIGVFPAPNTNDLHYMDGYWFTMKSDGSVWNCAVDDPLTWPTINFIYAQMLPGRGAGLSKQNNALVAFTDRHMQFFYDAANPVGSPLANIEQAAHRIGCAATDTIAFQEDTTFWVSNTLTGGFTVYRLNGIAQLEDIGTPTLERSLISNFFSIPGSPTPTQVILTSGTSWTIPGDFNKNNNTIEAIGGGAGGAGGAGNNLVAGGGGGGGAYTKITNFDPLGAGSISYVIGAAGLGQVGFVVPTAGGDTTFNSTSLVAKGGGSDGNYFDGGLASASTGSIKNSGGNGGAAQLGSFGGGGGGGAAGKIGDGAPGQAGIASGAGGTGGQGDPALGGSGGGSNTAGNAGAEWGSAGSGGGGGGGSFGNGVRGSVGKPGGNYGAGGGGGGGDNVGGGTNSGGDGTQGVIIITYTPSNAAVDSAGNGYILRIAGHMFYVLNLMVTNETWVYDVKYKIWSKWLSASGIHHWPVVNSVQYTATGSPSIIAGQDHETGTIWKLDPSLNQDNGSNYTVRIQTTPLTHGSMVRKFYNRVELIGDKQNTSTPVSVSYTDSDYSSFTPARTLDMGNTRAFSRSWGNSRRRAWRLDYTGPNPLRLAELELSFTEETDL